VSWRKWPDVIIDSGRELYIPWRISSGEMLYRDIQYLYGPLASYVNALLFSLFGTSLLTLVVFNLLVIGLLTLCIHKVFRRLFDRFTATLCGLVFLGTFAFARYSEGGNANFVCPYSHDLTYGIALFFLLALTLDRYLACKTRWRAATAGFLLGLMFLTKAEVFLAALVAAGIGFLLAEKRAGPRGTAGAVAAVCACAGFAVPPLFFIALFSTRTSVKEAASMISTGFRSLGYGPLVTNIFFQQIAGFDKPAANAFLGFAALAVYVALALGVLVLARLTARTQTGNHRHMVIAGVLLPLGAVVILSRNPLWWVYTGRPLPLIVLAYLLILLWPFLGRRESEWNYRRNAMRFVLCSFSLLLMMKILLQVHFSGPYGFALALPAALVAVAIFTHHLPRISRRAGWSGTTARTTAAAIVLCCLAVYVRESLAVYDLLTLPVGEGNDRFFTMAPSISDRGPAVNETLAFIETRMPVAAGFVVIPDGVMLNYLARRRNPGRWFEFVPPQIAVFGEERIRDDLEASRPEYVILVSQTTDVFGPTYFGNDYGFKLKEWVTENYTPVHLAGSRIFSTEGYGIAVAERTRRGP